MYDAGIKRFGSEFKKSGRSATYAGGFACRTVADAKRLIASETGRGRGWAVYAVDADWDTDTIQDTGEWWHRLLKDAVVIKKVATRESKHRQRQAD